jgi:hypothetical protein
VEESLWEVGAKERARGNHSQVCATMVMSIQRCHPDRHQVEL